MVTNDLRKYGDAFIRIFNSREECEAFEKDHVLYAPQPQDGYAFEFYDLDGNRTGKWEVCELVNRE